ncbi:MAG: hypothetical protein KIH03_04540 [Paludibacteraceae bacterium]|nr:hypothetical protein [Paludibacteraceae bacterium]
MLKIEKVEVVGWEHAIRGMRNPMNSWEKSDSGYCVQDLSRDCNNCVHKHTNYPTCRCGGFDIGPNDYALMKKLRDGGPVHAKYRRMITVYLDITAPMYWWKEFDTYKVGTVANSCSTMHKIHEKEFTLEDFSCEHLMGKAQVYNGYVPTSVLECTIGALNEFRKLYLETKDKKYWWQMIQLLPSSYNQKRTVMLNYEVLANIYESRKDHKLDEWHTFCHWIDELPYSELITGYEEE